MSWDSYTTTLTKSGHVAQAAVCGLDGSIWSQSPGMNVKPDEVKKLVDGFKNADALREHGVHLSGVKYFCLQADDTTLQGKKGSTGISAAKATKCVVIGQYDQDKGMQPGNCRNQVEYIRSHLLSAGY